MHPLVRDLYKRFLVVGREYPQGLSHVRERAKAAFLANAALVPGGPEAARAVHRGRWWVREIAGVSALKKYRAMRARYGAASSGDADLEARLEAKLAALGAKTAAKTAGSAPTPDAPLIAAPGSRTAAAH